MEVENQSNKKQVPLQCFGITKQKKRCQNIKKSGCCFTLCHHHENQLEKVNAFQDSLMFKDFCKDK